MRKSLPSRIRVRQDIALGQGLARNRHRSGIHRGRRFDHDQLVEAQGNARPGSRQPSAPDLVGESPAFIDTTSLCWFSPTGDQGPEKN
jgi:hypothetical protein